MPAERAKNTKTLGSVPGVGDPDRKRVLNVLAQRRYRQRRKEKVAALEAQTKATPSPPDTQQHNDEQTEIEWEVPSDSCHGPRLEDVEEVEELGRMPPQENLQMFDFDQDPFGLDLMQDFNSFPGLPSPIPSTPSLNYNRQSLPSSPLQFPLSPDGAILSLPILSVVRAFANIATALDVATNIWDPFYLHVLPQSSPGLASLPSNLHPVAAQHTIPHHPVLDVLPWPSVREKLICMLSMPSTFRPPIAQEDDDLNPSSLHPSQSPSTQDSPSTSSRDGGIRQSSAVVRLVQDLDDFRDGGGVRVHGNTSTWSEGNELVEEAWEIGDLFYRKWWWCLDQHVVEASNRKRGQRGLGKLRMVDTR